MNLVDTSGWLEYFADTASAKHFGCAIESNTSSLIVPTIVIYEVFKKSGENSGRQGVCRRGAQLKLGLVAPVDEAVACWPPKAKLSDDLKLPMADALIYAAAQLQ